MAVFPVQAGTGRIPPKGSYPFTEATFVQSLANKGYETICIGGVNFFSKRNELGRVFPGYFTKSYWLPILAVRLLTVRRSRLILP